MYIFFVRCWMKEVILFHYCIVYYSHVKSVNVRYIQNNFNIISFCLCLFSFLFGIFISIFSFAAAAILFVQSCTNIWIFDGYVMMVAKTVEGIRIEYFLLFCFFFQSIFSIFIFYHFFLSFFFHVCGLHLIMLSLQIYTFLYFLVNKSNGLILFLEKESSTTTDTTTREVVLLLEICVRKDMHTSI